MTAMNNIQIKRYFTLNDISEEIWEKDNNLPLAMKYKFLKAVEVSAINNIKPIYLKFYKNRKPVGQANLYIVDTDLSTMDSSLSESTRNTIKKWYPGFMTFKTLECGYFTTMGEGLIISNRTPLSEILPTLLHEMDSIANEYDVDIKLIRDIPLNNYSLYWEILESMDYFPALGFPDTCLTIQWESLDDYLNDLKSRTRKYFRRFFKLKDNFNIEYEYVKDYTKLCSIIEKLCSNVNRHTHDYSREMLNKKYFEGLATYMSDNSEVLIFRHNNEIVGVSVCVFDNEDYISLDWGADFNFEHYRKSHLFRAATFFNLKRAIELKKKKLWFGVTNYTPKLIIGANAIPLVYFVQHHKEKRYSKTLAKLITAHITQPDNNVHRPFKTTDIDPIDIQSVSLKIKKDQNKSDDKDIFYKIPNFYKTDGLRVAGLYNLYPEFTSAQGSSVIIKNKRVILLGTNSYLGAAYHPDIIKAAKKAIDKYGTGCSGSPLLNGTCDIHNQLEQELAQFLNREAVVLCSTGYQTNLAGISSLCHPNDTIILDERSHRSLFDGARLSGATCYVYRHNDMRHLKKILDRLESKSKIILTDSIFSMEGIIADLKAICELAKTYNARLFVDEAHAIGVLGDNGRGACEMLGVEKDVDLVMCTFSKSFASIGGFIAGDFDVIDYIKHNAGGHMFSASLPPSAIATVQAVLTLIKEKPELRKSVLEKAEYMATSLNEIGYNAHYYGTQIVPVIFANRLLAFASYKKFMEDGVYVNPIGPPAVPEKSSGFRTSYIASHKWEDLDFALEIFMKHSKYLTGL